MDLFEPGKIKHYIAGKRSEPRTMIIDIKQKNFKKLKFNRDKALSLGLIITDADSYVPAKVRVNNNTYKVDLRLKGDYVDHLEGKKWSLRIKVDGDNTIWGMKRFSIQSPERSGYMKEWLFHRFLKYEGLIGLRYDFIRVFINGVDMGIYALEESFSKELIENNKRREGPIIKFDESSFIASTKYNAKTKSFSERDFYLASDILSFRTGKILETKNLRNDFMTARALLYGLRARQIKLEEAVDVEQAAKTFAILSLLNAYHAIRWKNVRFYFNPIKQKLELIPYNAFGPGLEHIANDYDLYEVWLDGFKTTPEWYALFYESDVFVRSYFRELNRISQPGYLESFILSIKDDFRLKQNIIYKDGPLSPTPISFIFESRNKFYKELSGKGKVRAFLDDIRDNSVTLEYSNTTAMPLLIKSLSCKNTGNVYPVNISDKGRNRIQIIKTKKITVNNITDEDIQNCLKKTKTGQADNLVFDGLSIDYSVSGVDRDEHSEIDAYTISVADKLFPTDQVMELTLEKFLSQKMITIDHQKKIIVIKPGKWVLDTDLMIPSGYQLIGHGAIIIVQNNNAAIISRSAVNLSGTSEYPFIITSEDNSGQGLFVVDATGSSQLNHVVFTKLNNINRNGWELTGAVTFYESSIQINNVIFENINAEDMLNIVRSDFLINKSSFFQSKSDAVDIDFGTGTITQSIFKKCVNDCIDVSGTQIQISETNINNAGDKGISVGENSTAVINRTVIKHSLIGIASKDKSYTQLGQSTIEYCDTGLSAYQKKPEFGGATIDATNVVFNNTKKHIYADNDSKINILAADL